MKLLLKKKISVDSSPSIQIYCGDEASYIIGMTDQILDQGRYYLGNVYPSQYYDHSLTDEILDQSKVLLQYLHTIGYRGFAGIDFMISDNQVYVAEINARFTGATPATIVSIILHNNLTKSRKFLSFNNSTSTVEEMIDQSSIHHSMPISIGGLNTRGTYQSIERF